MVNVKMSQLLCCCFGKKTLPGDKTFIMVASNASNFIKILLFLCFLPLIIDCNSQAEEETLPKGM